MILKGNDALEKANKMMESLNVSQKVDSFSNVEKTFSAYNGKRYGIVKEGTKYIIKEATVKNAKNPSDFEYIDGVQNKSKYSKNTLLEAERTLNLWNIEFSRVYGTSLIKEQDEMPEDEESTKKTVLKVPVKKSAAPAMDMPPMDMAAPAPDATAEAPAEGMPTDMPPMPAGEEGAEPMPEEGGEDEESGVDPKKSIQKLAGKLAYELREFEGEDEDYSDVYKFAASMVISAADADKITEKDKKSIKNKVEKSLTVDEEDELPEDETEEMPEETEEMPEETEEMPAGEEKMEKTLAEALKRIKKAKKELGNREVLDKNKNGILDKEDFKLLRKSKKQEAVEMPMNEGLKGKPISVWIKDFMDSKNPKFKGKSKKKRREMAIAAFLEYERSQGKDSSVTYVKGKKSKGKKSLKEGSDYGMPMEGNYMSEEDDFRFDEGKKNKLLLDKEYMSEEEGDNDLIEFTVPTWAVAVLINGDYSGLEDEDAEKIYSFIDYVQIQHGNANFMLGEKSDDEWFARRNDIDSLGSNVTILYIRPDKTEEEYMNEVRAFGEDDDYPYGITNLYEDEDLMEDDFTFEMDYSQKKK